ncbi:DUF6438 domain-containing protein [Kordia algicida OT-1]|uniref:DUF6438 domain-containing protein n=1 Tax=Kordia algicida OT-1 TaxID=391587 RepID=A9DXF1_9FLAO|nr:DUF6438 domain-containing protein [Kordia algicida]EDP95996.1 hypothetical protein KAOT1_07503 [Kordia algicida OT-1]
MKKLILIILLIFISNSVFAQTIENLKTFKEVATFLEKEINKEYTFEAIFEGEDEIDTEDFNEVVQKIDLDNDGDTDLVIDYIGDTIFILNKDNDTFKEIKMLDVSRIYKNEDLESISMERIKNQTFFIRKIKISKFDVEKYKNIIVEKNQKDFQYDREKNKVVAVIRDFYFRKDTLVIKYGEFVQLNSKWTKHTNEIKEIHFEATPCYGSCPAFEMKITSDGNLEYHGKRFVNFKGQKKLKLRSEEVKTLFRLIEYTDVKSLKDRYAVNATDNPSAILKVTFKNGDVKEIYDYGRFGTYNLRVIYKKLFEINNNIK